MATCYRHGDYDGGIFTTCPHCDTIKTVEKTSREIKDAMSDSLRERERLLEEDRWEQERMLEEHRAEQAELIGEALEEQRRIAEETLEEQRRIAAEAAEEHARIASEAWQLEAQKKAEQAGKLFNSGLSEEALKLAGDAISKDPTCMSGYLWAVFAAGSIGKNNEAQVYASKAIRLLQTSDYKNAVRTHGGVFLALLRIGNPPELIRQYVEIVHNNSKRWRLSDKGGDVFSLFDDFVANKLLEGARSLIDNSVSDITYLTFDPNRLQLFLSTLKILRDKSASINEPGLSRHILEMAKKSCIQMLTTVESFSNHDPNNLSTLKVLMDGSASINEAELSRYLLQIADKVCIEKLKKVPVRYSDQHPSLMIPLLTYNLEIDHRLGNKNDGQRVDDFLSILDSGTITISPTSTTGRPSASGISIDPSALRMIKSDNSIQRKIDSDDVRLLKEAVNGIKSDKNISEVTTNALRNKIIERYEKSWKHIFANSAKEKIKNTETERPKGFVSYIVGVLICWSSLLIIFIVIEGKEKLNAEIIGNALVVSLVFGPIISAIVLFPLVLLLYPLEKIYRNRKAKKAADEVLKQKLDI